jgi:hypothetical protein
MLAEAVVAAAAAEAVVLPHSGEVLQPMGAVVEAAVEMAVQTLPHQVVSVLVVHKMMEVEANQYRPQHYQHQIRHLLRVYMQHWQSEWQHSRHQQHHLMLLQIERRQQQWPHFGLIKPQRLRSGLYLAKKKQQQDHYQRPCWPQLLLQFLPPHQHQPQRAKPHQQHFVDL